MLPVIGSWRESSNTAENLGLYYFTLATPFVVMVTFVVVVMLLVI